jgi:uncharacterized protein involved in cysteine biosynthesis
MSIFIIMFGTLTGVLAVGFFVYEIVSIPMAFGRIVKKATKDKKKRFLVKAIPEAFTSMWHPIKYAIADISILLLVAFVTRILDFIPTFRGMVSGIATVATSIYLLVKRMQHKKEIKNAVLNHNYRNRDNPKEVGSQITKIYRDLNTNHTSRRVPY